MMKPGHSDPPMYAGALADRVQSLENCDVFGGVVAGCHVYNCALKRLQRAFLVTTIVAAIQAHLVPLAAAAIVSEDVPVPGGRAALAATFQIAPIPDRARFVSEFARLLHGLSDRKATLPEVLKQQLRQSAAAASGASELVPVPLTAAVWSKAIFLRPVAAGDLVIEILANRQASLLCYGLAALDDETLQYLADHPAVLTQIYALGVEPFAVFSEKVRVQGGRIVPPGVDEASRLWEDVVGASLARPDRFLVALFTQNEGRMARLYDTIGQLDLDRQRFALGLWMNDSSARLDRMRALAAASIASAGDWRALKAQPFVRQPHDLTALLMRVRAAPAGLPTAPSSLNFWTRAVESVELPSDPARILKESADGDRAIDAAWLAGLTIGDIRLRGERLDQFAFGQRVLPERPPPTCRTCSSRARVPSLSDAHDYARTDRHPQPGDLRGSRASREPHVAAGSRARLSRSRSSRSAGAAGAHANGRYFDARKAETLVGRLLAVPLSASSHTRVACCADCGGAASGAPAWGFPRRRRAGRSCGTFRRRRLAKNRMGRAAIPSRRRGRRRPAIGART
jgi:hypothetical protein